MKSSSALFSPLQLRELYLPNRVVVSPLCMYSAVDGVAQPWHLAHLSTFARGRAGLVFAEATAVEARANVLRWAKCQGCAMPSMAEYMHSGETTIRLGKFRSRNCREEKSAELVFIGSTLAIFLDCGAGYVGREASVQPEFH